MQTKSIERRPVVGLREIWRLKRALRSISPAAYRRFRSWYWSMRARSGPDLLTVADTMIEQYGSLVLSGPFAGMKYIRSAAGSALAPKLLGSYEAELHSAIAHSLDRERRVVVDIGCAEGYYAVGYAFRWQNATVYAFDSDENARQLCHHLAVLNRLQSRALVRGTCTNAKLRCIPLDDALIICDCEGAELELLRPDLVPGLRTSTLIVELHDSFQEGITDEIASRFSDSHDITLIHSRARDAGQYPELRFLSSAKQRLALFEDRGISFTRWGFLQPKVRHRD